MRAWSQRTTSIPSQHPCRVHICSAGEITRFPLSPPIGASLSSEAFASTFNLKMVPRLFFALKLEEDEAFCVIGDEDGGVEG